MVTLVKFVMEQLLLVQVLKNDRRYSVNLLTSTYLNKKLKNLFLLLSISHLRQLSNGMTVEEEVLDVHYLKL